MRQYGVPDRLSCGGLRLPSRDSGGYGGNCILSDCHSHLLDDPHKQNLGGAVRHVTYPSGQGMGRPHGGHGGGTRWGSPYATI